MIEPHDKTARMARADMVMFESAIRNGCPVPAGRMGKCNQCGHRNPVRPSQ